MARGYLEQAEDALAHAEASQLRRRWGMAVRRSQESVELALKSALRCAGVEVPRLHDVADVLRAAREKFPAPFVAVLDRFAEWSTELAADRIASLYGDERAGQAANRLFGEAEAGSAVERARQVLKAARDLMGE